MPNEVIESLPRAWVSFFRAMGWQFEYQPVEEEAVLPCGTVYLPTFKVRTGYGVYFFEVREDDTCCTYEVDEYVRVTGDQVILVTGRPSGTTFNWVCVNTFRSDTPEHTRAMWSPDADCIVEVLPGDDRTVVQVAGIPFLEAACAWFGDIA